jgi:CheY-like chemotaxis protein
MNAIIGLTYLSLNQNLPPKIRKYLNTIQTSAQTLLEIINDILDFSKIEAGKLEIQPVEFELTVLLENLVDIFFNKTAEKDIELIISVPDNVPSALIGDSLRLEQVLINLTSNAVKFTGKGEIFISVTCVKKNNEMARLRFSIKDTGIGITREQISRLFNAFIQADGSTTKKYGGTGLGLVISKRLVELMGGILEVESEPGKGSNFYFELNFNRQAPDREGKFIIPQQLKGLKAIVLDDNELYRKTISEILTSFTFKVVSVSSGGECISILKDAANKEPFNLIILNWKTPDLDGPSIIKLIKEEMELKAIPIIMMSPYDMEGKFTESDIVGTRAIIYKPVKHSELFNAIIEIFSGNGLKPEADKGNMALLDIDGLAGARVLLVEDNEINQEVSFELLQYAGINVDIANNGKEALEYIKQNSYDAVLMDVQMPEMDGYEATGIIKKDESLKRLPVIGMTAYAMKGDKEKCLQAGMNDYVSKPIEASRLFSILKKWIKVNS